MRSKKRRGFTLIEFLIALVVIGFIVSLLINYFSNPLKEASMSSLATSIVQDGQAMVNASNLFMARKGTLPSRLEEVATEGFLTEDLSAKDFTGAPLHAGWYSDIQSVHLGDGTSRKMAVFSMSHNNEAAAVCRKINQKLLETAENAAIPTVAGDETTWAARPAETVGRGNFCLDVAGNSYTLYLSI